MSEHDPLITEMAEIGERLIAQNDERQHVHGAYLRSTRAVMEDAAAGHFAEPAGR